MNKRNKIKSLKYYLSDKEELINQVFSSISEKQIKKMIPLALKDMSTDELKAECLVQLLTMSSNKIVSILEGRKCIEDTIFVDTKDNKKNSKKRTNRSITDLIGNKKRKLEKDDESTTIDQQNNISFSKGPGNGSRKKHKEKKYKVGKKNKSDEDEKNDPYSKEKNLLELLELEMRAKAIRSLLKQEEEEELDKRNDQNENIKMETEFKQEEKNEKSLGILRSEVKYPNEITIDGKERRICLQGIPSESQQMENVQSSLELKISSQNSLDNVETVEEKYDWNEEEKLLYEDDDSDEKTESDIYREKEKSEDNSTKSWAERWLQSKDVKKVVATSKMLAAVRNKMKNNSKTVNTTKNAGNHKLQPIEMIGTVKEYDTLEQMESAVIEDAKKKNRD